MGNNTEKAMISKIVKKKKLFLNQSNINEALFAVFNNFSLFLENDRITGLLDGSFISE